VGALPTVGLGEDWAALNSLWRRSTTDYSMNLTHRPGTTRKDRQTQFPSFSRVLWSIGSSGLRSESLLLFLATRVTWNTTSKTILGRTSRVISLIQEQILHLSLFQSDVIIGLRANLVTNKQIEVAF